MVVPHPAGASLSRGKADSPLHVLVIHRRDATEGYASYLAGEGFRVSEANDSDDGVKKSLALLPDFIVLDFDLDGETTARLKSHISTRGIPVIALAKMADVRARGAVSEEKVDGKAGGADRR